jgi:dTDP-4-amino-4,6-dideoxygalactose transaminase
MPEVAFLDLRRVTKVHRCAIEAAIAEVLDAGRFILGDKVAAFEDAFASFCGVAHGIGVASGTDALRLALGACGVESGEVLTVSNTCVPTVAAIVAARARPVFVDVDPVTYTMDPLRIEAALTPQTRAIVPVHLYGQCADMPAIMQIARRHGLRVVEDCAQAHGARLGGVMAGAFGDAGCYSFYPTKNLGALGDAGMVVTSDGAIADAVRLGRNYGQAARDTHVVHGSNSRLDELQAAVLLAGLPRLDASNERRRAIAAVYAEGLADTGLVVPREAPGRHHVYHLYVVRARDRDGFRARLAERGVGTLVHYPVAVHQQEAYCELAEQGAVLPVTNRVVDEILSLPLYPELEAGEIDAVIAAARASA